MKSNAILIIFIFILNQSVFCQWEEKNINSNALLTSVEFLNNDHGFATGEGQIYKTTDGGDNWEISYSDDDAFIEDVIIVAENIILAAGYNYVTNESLIVRTIDDGANWEVIDAESSENLNSLFFISTSTGFCSGSNGTILKTTDGGSSWQKMNSGGINESLQDIFFVDDSIGIAVGGGAGSSLILKTYNGGIDWTMVDSPVDNYLQSVYFTNPQTGIGVGWNGAIIKTEDSGSSWTSLNSVSMFGNLQVKFTDENTGYIVGGSVDVTSILKTVNGGGFWEDISPDFFAGLVGIDFPSFDVGYAVGANGVVLKTESGGISTSTSNLFSLQEFLLYPNPTTNAVTIESMENDKIKWVKIYTGNGHLIQEKKVYANQSFVDLTGFPSGNYYVELSTDKSKSIKRLVKR